MVNCNEHRSPILVVAEVVFLISYKMYIYLKKTKAKKQIRTEQTNTFLSLNDVKVMLCHLFKKLITLKLNVDRI